LQKRSRRKKPPSTRMSCIGLVTHACAPRLCMRLSQSVCDASILRAWTPFRLPYEWGWQVSESDLRFLMAAMLSICVIQMKHKELERREKELTIREMLNNSESSLVDLRQVGIRWCTAARQQHSKHAYANSRAWKPCVSRHFHTW
jgi:hypothetical protein